MFFFSYCLHVISKTKESEIDPVAVLMSSVSLVSRERKQRWPNTAEPPVVALMLRVSHGIPTGTGFSILLSIFARSSLFTYSSGAVR